MELKDEIVLFLKRNGFVCRETVILGQTGISVICPSGAEKTVLPIEIKEETVEEAEKRQGQSVLFRGKLYCPENEDSPYDHDNETYPIIVTEDRWIRQPEMMRRRLLAHLEIFHSIYARNCEIRRIEKAESAAFLEANHSYGDASCRYRYGMFLKRYTGHTARQLDGTAANGGDASDRPELLAPGTLVAVAEFSNARRWQKGDRTVKSHEWTRYASLAGVRICGGMGRMLRHFIKEVQPDDIMSYADLEWSDGEAYRKLGFVAEAFKSPVMFSIDPDTWKRTPLRLQPDGAQLTGSAGNAESQYPVSIVSTTAPTSAGTLFFRNFGSIKYRLKITKW